MQVRSWKKGCRWGWWMAEWNCTSRSQQYKSSSSPPHAQLSLKPSPLDQLRRNCSFRLPRTTPTIACYLQVSTIFVLTLTIGPNLTHLLVHSPIYSLGIHLHTQLNICLLFHPFIYHLQPLTYLLTISNFYLFFIPIRPLSLVVTWLRIDQEFLGMTPSTTVAVSCCGELFHDMYRLVGQWHEDVERKREYYHITIFPERTCRFTSRKKRKSGHNNDGILHHHSLPQV